MESLKSVPDEPLALARRWLDDAVETGGYNPWAMALSTVDAEGRPACRFVLLKGFDTRLGFAVFYTNYLSRKAHELDATGWAAASLYWPPAGRQLRLEGRVTRSPDAESDAYFASRPRASQLNAWVSAQSHPLSAVGLEPVLASFEGKFPEDTEVPRPPGWGGYRIWLDSVEFWVEGAARFHERVRYTRDIRDDGAGGFAGSDWQHVRLQP